VHCLRLLYTFRDVSHPSEVIPEPLYQIKAHRAGYQTIPRIFVKEIIVQLSRPPNGNI